ncbi:MAG TPA: hypothetical protein VHG51_11550 [Longimicrobiaceae bacterium]|nr:hypothetical protein [Longimicrobiaceae bacterium]
MSLSPLARPLLAAAMAAALPACATLGYEPRAADPALLSDAPARFADRGCAVDRAPEALPGADELVDTRRLAADAARLRTGPGAPSAGHVLLSLAYAPDGANVRRDVIEHSVAPRIADSLQKLVFAHRRVAAARPREWGVRMRIDLGAPEGPRFRVGRRELCAPHARGRGMFTLAALTHSAFADPYAEDRFTGYTVWVRVRLDELGRVTDAALEAGPLRRGTSEAMLLNYVRSMTFDPAVEDGRPIPSETRVPVRLPG